MEMSVARIRVSVMHPMGSNYLKTVDWCLGLIGFRSLGLRV